MKIKWSYFIIVLLALGCGTNIRTKHIQSLPHPEFSVQLDTISGPDQENAIKFASIGQYDNAIRSFEGGCPPPPLDDSAVSDFEQNYHPKEAIDLISEKADFAQVVMINHLKHITAHHAFTQKLLQKLHNKGYRNFGIEGIHKPVTSEYCPYSENNLGLKDPHFINLIREAVS